MSKINDRWAKLILWAGSYVNVILFALIGGYYWLKTDREELKKECKKVLYVTLIFLILEMIIELISTFITLCNIAGNNFIFIVSSIVIIAKICTYAIFGLFALLGVRITTSENKKEEEKGIKSESKDEATEVGIVESNKQD
ncbi:MAG: hypothetical protein ACI4TX_04420 [Christensenellales bacterium]